MEEEYKEFLETDWDAQRIRILLFADIMGFKAKVQKNNHAELVKEFRRFINELTNLMEPLETGRHLRLTMFSDSIIMGMDSCTVKNFNIITKAAALLMSLCYEYEYPINGSIACGSLTLDEQIQTPEMEAMINSKRKVKPYMPLFVGNSVVDAHILHSKVGTSISIISDATLVFHISYENCNNFFFDREISDDTFPFCS